MIRSRSIVPVIALAAAFGLAPGASAKESPKTVELDQRVQALEAKIAALEQTLNQRLAAMEQKLAQAPPAAAAPVNAELEAKAESAYQEILRSVTAGETAKAKAGMDEFKKTYGSTQVAQKARRSFEELAVVDKPVPANWGFTKWFQGEGEVDLSAKKATLVVFWEEWCPHCKREVPKLQQIYTDLKGQGLQVVGVTKVNRGATDEKVAAFITENKITYPVAKEDGQATAHFGVSGVPAAAVLKDGKVVWRGHPAQLTPEKLKSWL